MRLEEAIQKARKGAQEAQEAGVKAVFVMDWDATFRRPLKTLSGTIDRLKQYSRHYLWDGTLIVRFIGANGKEYKSAKLAAKHGSK